MRVGHVGYAEIDDLDRIVFHHENVARLQIAMYQASLMRRLQAAARLGKNPDGALDGQAMAGFANKSFERGAGQKRHHEIRFFLAVFLELANIENLNNVGMAHGGEHIAFLVEQLQRSGIGNIENSLNRDFPANDSVIGPVDQAHAAVSENLPNFVAASQFSRRNRTFHGPPQARPSILMLFAEKWGFVLK